MTIENCVILVYLRQNVVELRGHDQLLEIRLLKKSARHDFIITWQRSSNNYFSCQLVVSRP